MVRQTTFLSVVSLTAWLTLVFCAPQPAVAQDDTAAPDPATADSASDAAADPGDSEAPLAPVPAGQAPSTSGCVPLPDGQGPRTGLIRTLLGMFESADRLDPKYKMHDKLSKEEKDMVRATLLQIDNDMHLLISGRSPLSECYQKMKTMQVVIDPESGERRLVPGPQQGGQKKLMAGTAGIEKTDDQSSGIESPGGATAPRRSTVTGGRATPHGTVIYRGGRGRGRSSFRGTRPKVINIPPPRNQPTPAPEPEPERAPEPTPAPAE